MFIFFCGNLSIYLLCCRGMIFIIYFTNHRGNLYFAFLNRLWYFLLIESMISRSILGSVGSLYSLLTFLSRLVMIPFGFFILDQLFRYLLADGRHSYSKFKFTLSSFLALLMVLTGWNYWLTIYCAYSLCSFNDEYKFLEIIFYYGIIKLIKI